MSHKCFSPFSGIPFFNKSYSYFSLLFFSFSAFHSAGLRCHVISNKNRNHSIDLVKKPGCNR